MKALTLTQPWATLVAVGSKCIETRSWSTKYRGPLAIHAAKGFPKSAKDICYDETFWNALMSSYPQWDRMTDKLPRGSVIATCQLVHVMGVDQVVHLLPTLWTPQEKTFGNYTFGRYAWILEDVKMLPEPIPAKGARRLWEWERP